MLQSHNTTIIALATPPGFSGIAVIRLSGPAALSITNATICLRSPLQPRHATLCEITDGAEHLDSVVVTYYKAPRSYTGEDVVEISSHGSPYVVEKIIQLFLVTGARLAEPGEYTRRAFLNGKIDLSQAEGVIDLIYARARASHRASMNLLEGQTGQTIKQIRQKLMDMIALFELELDFVENEVEPVSRNIILSEIYNVKQRIETLISSFEYGKLVRLGVLTPIIGPPNSGKSSLLNAFLQEERAIVSPLPGTTRDTIEEIFQKNGFLFRLVDTAGLHPTEDDIESQGIDRARQTIERADLIILVIDLTNSNRNILDSIPLANSNIIIALNKVDLATSDQISQAHTQFDKYIRVPVSAKYHTHIHELAKMMVANIKDRFSRVTDTIITRQRHRDVLVRVNNFLDQSVSSIKSDCPNEIIVIDLRDALGTIDEILGKSTNDDILDQIFSQFCIGK
jgi:tRNA modification GTPase